MKSVELAIEIFLRYIFVKKNKEFLYLLFHQSQRDIIFNNSIQVEIFYIL
jgi:hypothetical protein